MNFTHDVVAAAPRNDRALVELTREGARREWTFGELTEAAAASPAGSTRGDERGDVILTLVGNRAEWAITMLACFRQGYVVLPCTEQLRPKDLALRLQVAQPRLVVADVAQRRDAARRRLDRRDAVGPVRGGAARARPRRPRSSPPRTRA